MLVENKEITWERVHILAENALKMTDMTNSPKLFNKLLKTPLFEELEALTEDLQDTMYKSMINIELNRPANESEVRMQCINDIANVITKNTGIKSEPDKLGRRRTSMPDYVFETVNNGVTTSLVIEVKNCKSSLFTNRGELKAGFSKQVSKYAAEFANGMGYCLVILTNGEQMAVTLKGNIECSKAKYKGWQPLRNEAVPILTMSCKNISVEECKVIAALIFFTLMGNYEKIVNIVKDTYEDELENLERRLIKEGIKLV